MDFVILQLFDNLPQTIFMKLFQINQNWNVTNVYFS